MSRFVVGETMLRGVSVGRAARIEIQDRPDMESAHAQAGVQMCFMRGQNGRDCLDLNDHFARDGDIGPEALAARPGRADAPDWNLMFAR